MGQSTAASLQRLNRMAEDPNLSNTKKILSEEAAWLLHDPSFLDFPKLQIRTRAEIIRTATAVGAGVFLIALGLQWIIYDGLMHLDGIRIVGSTIAAVLAAILTERLESLSRARSLQELRRLEVVALMNHHVRNALQAILYSSGGEAAAVIEEAVQRIEWALREVLPQVDRIPSPESSGEERVSRRSA